MWWTSKRRRPIRITRMRIAFTYIVFECYGPHGDANLIHLRHALLYSNTQQVNAIRITCSYHIQLHTPSRLYSNGIHIGQRGNMRMWCASVNANAMSIHVFEWHSGQHIHITFTSDEHRLHTPAIRIKTEYGIHIWFESLVRISDSNQNRIPYSHLIRIAYSHFRFESKPNTIFTSDSHRVFAFQIRIKTEYHIHIWFASRIRISDSNQNRIPYSHVIRIAYSHVRFESKPSTVFTCDSNTRDLLTFAVSVATTLLLEHVDRLIQLQLPAHFAYRWICWQSKIY